MRFAAIIPVFNERLSLPLVVGDLRDPRIGEIVVVDNGSSDGTGSVAATLPVRVVAEPRRGYGSACLAGIAALAAAPPTAFSSRAAAIPILPRKRDCYSMTSARTWSRFPRARTGGARRFFPRRASGTRSRRTLR